MPTRIRARLGSNMTQVENMGGRHAAVDDVYECDVQLEVHYQSISLP